MQEKDISEIYIACNREIFAYLVRNTGSRENAEDLLHDTFAALISYSKTHAIDMKTVRAFLYKTAHNLAINFMKRNARSVLSENLDTLEGSSSVEEDSSARLLQSEIYRVLDTIDVTDRSIFIMKKELTMSTVEIAPIVGKSERTVRRSLEKTLKILALELEKTGFLPKSVISMAILFLSLVLLTEGRE